MIKSKHMRARFLTTVLVVGSLLPSQLMAKHFFPCTADQLEAAIIQANLNCEDDVIDLQCNSFELTASDNSTPTNGSNGLPVIGPDSGHKLKIKNGVISRSTAMITQEFRFFEVNPDAFLILEEVTLENGVVATGTGLAVSGGAILNQGTVELKDSTIVGFVEPATLQPNALLGGAIYNDIGATLHIKGSTFAGNQAADGGAVFNASTISEICSTRFVNNVAIPPTVPLAMLPPTGQGGAIFNQANSTIALIRRSIFDQNQAMGVGLGYGGAISNDGSASPAAAIETISYTTFINNSATASGGAIMNEGSISVIFASTLAYNRAPGNGGGIYNLASIGAISNSTFSSNVSGENGGGINNFTGAIIGALTNNTIVFNFVGNDGGGIYDDGLILSIISNLVAQNKATGGTSPDIFLDHDGNLGTPKFNLIGDGAHALNGSVCNVFLSAYQNLVGNCVLSEVIDPLLESLANNGGPTLTHALRPLSPAIDTGFNPAPLELKFDQRGPGHPRTMNGLTDIGSFELCADFDGDGDCDDNGHCDDNVGS